MRDRFFKIFILIGVIFLIEISFFYGSLISRKTKLEEEYKTKIKVIGAKQEQAKKKLENDFEQNKYLATGKNVYERIYNTQGQSIISLISRLTDEVLPEDWKGNAKAEEFTNFILLIQTKADKNKPSVDQVTKYIIPIIKYTHPYLSNITVFDKNHKCYLYFDESTLEQLRISGGLDTKIIQEVKRQGTVFTKFNSINIDFQQIEGHIFIPAVIGGVYECLMMLDTGASTTVISKELAGKTSFEGEDWNKLESRTFHTAKGLMTCPIVKRSVLIGGIERKLPVAINISDELNLYLLGVDFLKDYNYSIDSQDNCIYIWSK